MNDLIKKAVELTRSRLDGHYKTLLGERSKGSRWGRDFTEQDFELDWTQTDNIPPSVKDPNCTYFYLTPEAVMKSFPKAVIRALPLYMIDETEYHHVRLELSEHGGVEFVVDEANLGDEGAGGAADVAWLILGPEVIDDSEEQVIYTIHPGPLMKPLPADFHEQSYAVKVV